MVEIDCKRLCRFLKMSAFSGIFTVSGCNTRHNRLRKNKTLFKGIKMQIAQIAPWSFIFPISKLKTSLCKEHISA